MDTPPAVVVISERIEASELARLVRALFEDMVKYVVDVERRVIGLGGEMHVDAEQALLEHGSRQADLWGANYYPGRGRDGCIEYTSLINIRPRSRQPWHGDRGPGAARARPRAITFELVGDGEPLT